MTVDATAPATDCRPLPGQPVDRLPGAELAVTFTGRYPRGMFDFVAGYLRWSIRIAAYLFGLTDKYPPFRMRE